MRLSNLFGGAFFTGSLVFIGWAAHDWVRFPPNCRDSLRIITPNDAGISCPYAGQSASYVELGDRPAIFCQCQPEPRRTGSTQLL